MNMTFTKEELPIVCENVLQHLTPTTVGATVVALSGDLGAGKTTLVQALASELGVTEHLISPTFVVMKRYDIKSVLYPYDMLIHIDAYRLTKGEELTRLGFTDLVENPRNLIIIEWPEHVQGCLPVDAMKVSLSHRDEQTRNLDY